MHVKEAKKDTTAKITREADKYLSDRPVAKNCPSCAGPQ